MNNKLSQNTQSLQTSVSGSVILPTELRIGNYIHHNPDNAPFLDNYLTVSELGKNTISTFYIFQNQRFNVKNRKDYQPILITEEWLIKLGFKEISNKQDRDRKWFKIFEIEETDELVSLNLYSNNVKCKFDIDTGYGFKTITISYVHQLQNLYFALTGLELQLAV